MIWVWSPPLHCLHIASSRYAWRSSLLIPFFLFKPNFSRLQHDSTSWVCTPVRGSTKWRACTTTLCLRTFGRRARFLYAPPIVGVNLAARQKTLLYYGAKSRCVSPFHYSKITPRWTVFGRDNAKYPYVTIRSPSPVILQRNVNERVVWVFCHLQRPLGATWKINRLP